MKINENKHETKVRVYQVATEQWQNKLDELETFKDNGQIGYIEYQRQKRRIEKQKPSPQVSARAFWVLAIVGIIVIVWVASISGDSTGSTGNSATEKQAQEAQAAIDTKEANRVATIDKYAPMYCSSQQATRVTGMPEGYPVNDGRGWTQDECRTIIDKLYSENADDTRLQGVVERKVWTGMSILQLTYSWGNPNDINKTVVGDYESQQWVYPGYNYVYLRGGIVTSYQV